MTKEEFVIRSKKHFGNCYDYSQFEIIPSDGQKIPIRCNEHDTTFSQEPRSHIRGHTGCKKCISLKLSGNLSERGELKSQNRLNNDFLKRANTVHSNKYDYSKFTYVNSTTKGKIYCIEHGYFFQNPSNHLRGHQCPECSREKQKKGTFKETCREKGVNYHRALKRRQAGLSEEYIFREGYIRNERITKQISIYGKIYPNISEAVRSLNPPSSNKTIARMLVQGMTPEEAFERIPNPGYSKGIIYLVTNKINKKKYIGLTILSINRRWKNHVEQANALNIKSDQSLHAAIREHGESTFEIVQIDSGTTKRNLETKEREWIVKLNTLTPHGYNISTGGTSGGSHKKATVIDNIEFESVERAAEYVSKIKGISISAAKKRILVGRVHVNKPAKKGESLIHTKTYKVWDRIHNCVLNPKSRDYIKDIDVFEKWKNFKQFYSDVGEPDGSNMAFTRLEKTKGFFPDNCAWVTKSKSSKINAAYMKKMGLLTGRKKINKS